MAPKAKAGKAATPAKAGKATPPAKATTLAKPVGATKPAAAPAKAAPAPAKEEEKKAVEDPAKRKAEEKAEGAPPKKEAKKEEPSKTKKEDDGEKEKNAEKEKRPLLKAAIGFNTADTTLNVIPSAGAKLLMALTEGGMQYLIAGARANVGVKAGRYMYEVKIVEALNPAESSGPQRARVPMPRQLVRLGFSTAESSPLMGDNGSAAYFDSEGFYVCGNGKKVATGGRFTRDQVIAVVLNLDPESPNANTLSLFREGERIAEPQPLPEGLVGKTLFPHVSFRSVTVQMLFGPTPAKALPFTCHMLAGAAEADVVVAPAPKPDEKYDVLLPVSLPDEGSFDWLDDFLEKNPKYVELSDRKIQEWAALSGLVKPKSQGFQASNDKPQFNYGLPGMDDHSIRRVLNAMAPVVPRNYLVMEVKSNLVAADRQETLRRFGMPHFKKLAHVVVGEPSDEFKEKALEKKRQEKQAKADAEWKLKKAEEERKKQQEQRAKQLAEMRKKADEARKKAAEDAKKKREEDQKKKEAEKKAKEDAEKKAKGEEGAAEGEAAEAKEEVKAEEGAAMEVEKPEEKKEEEQAKEEVKEEEEKKEDEEMEKDEGPPQVELTEEEKKHWFRPVPPGTSGDLTSAVMGQSFASFTVPEEEEGFDDIIFDWQPAESSKDYLQTWVQERKLTSRIDDLKPGQWFTEKQAAWLKTYQDWQKKHKEYNNSPAKKAKDAAKKKKEEEKEKDEGGDEEGKDAEMEDSGDIFAIEDVCDAGEGEPLFANFTFEDWALLQLRVELYFLTVGFRKDVDDPDRLGIHEQHVAFYYNKYFKKQLVPKNFGVNTNEELCKMVKDTVLISEDTHVLTSQLAEETETTDIFVKLTEESRRERQRRIDAGDETAKLKFTPMAMQQPQSGRPTTPGAQGAAPRPAGAWPQAATPRPTGMQWGGARPATAQPRWPAAPRPGGPVRPAWGR